MEKNDLLVIGHTALDYIIRVKEFPKANSSTQIENMKQFDGGAGANNAFIASKLGLKTALISAVGGDFKNSSYFKKLKDLNINTDSLIVVPTESTPTAFVLTNEKDDQISYFYWGAGKEFANSKIPLKAIKDSKAIHLATGDPEFNWKCGKKAKELGLFVSFDPGQDLGMYSEEKLRDIIENTDILFGNEFEIERICDTLQLDIEGILNLGPKIVIKSCGSEGSEIYTQNEKLEIEAIKTEAVDPTGAGDSYRAGFLSRFLNGSSIEESAKFASAVSSFIVEAQGCQTKAPSFDEAYERMSEFYSD